MTSSPAPPASPRPPAPSATVLLVRDAPRLEVLMVKRHHQIDFASGALVFPGGKVDPSDAEPAWADHAAGFAEDPQTGPVRVAALREAFEESGLLLVDGTEARARIVDPADPGAARAREALARGELSFLDHVRALGVRLDLAALTPFARWITPSMMPRRFDTWFFIARAPEAQLALCDGAETVDAEWIAPKDALRLAEAGERKIIFPTRMNLSLLAESSGTEAALAAARARRVVTVEPRLIERDGERYLTLPEEAGYGRVEEALSAAL